MKVRSLSTHAMVSVAALALACLLAAGWSVRSSVRLQWNVVDLAGHDGLTVWIDPQRTPLPRLAAWQPFTVDKWMDRS